jgi:hypothetical protein
MKFAAMNYVHPQGAVSRHSRLLLLLLQGTKAHPAAITLQIKQAMDYTLLRGWSKKMPLVKVRDACCGCYVFVMWVMVRCGGIPRVEGPSQEIHHRLLHIQVLHATCL